MQILHYVTNCIIDAASAQGVVEIQEVAAAKDAGRCLIKAGRRFCV